MLGYLYCFNCLRRKVETPFGPALSCVTINSYVKRTDTEFNIKQTTLGKHYEEM